MTLLTQARVGAFTGAASVCPSVPRIVTTATVPIAPVTRPA